MKSFYIKCGKNNPKDLAGRLSPASCHPSCCDDFPSAPFHTLWRSVGSLRWPQQEEKHSSFCSRIHLLSNGFAHQFFLVYHESNYKAYVYHISHVWLYHCPSNIYYVLKTSLVLATDFAPFGTTNWKLFLPTMIGRPLKCWTIRTAPTK